MPPWLSKSRRAGAWTSSCPQHAHFICSVGVGLALSFPGISDATWWVGRVLAHCTDGTIRSFPPGAAPPLSRGASHRPSGPCGKGRGPQGGRFGTEMTPCPTQARPYPPRPPTESPLSAPTLHPRGSPGERPAARCPLPSAFEAHQWSHAIPPAPRRTAPLAKSQDGAPAGPGVPPGHQKVSAWVTAAHPCGTVSPVTPNRAAGSGQIRLQTHHEARM